MVVVVVVVVEEEEEEEKGGVGRCLPRVAKLARHDHVARRVGDDVVGQRRTQRVGVPAGSRSIPHEWRSIRFRLLDPHVRRTHPMGAASYVQTS